MLHNCNNLYTVEDYGKYYTLIFFLYIKRQFTKRVLFVRSGKNVDSKT